MKKKIVIALILSLSTILYTGCGKDDENNVDSGNTKDTAVVGTENSTDVSDNVNSESASSENANNESEEKGNATVSSTGNANTQGLVSFTLDPTFYGEMTDEQIAAAAKDQQYTNYKINEDRSVYVEVTKERQQQILAETRAEAERYFGNRVGSEMNPKLTGVQINGDMTQFDLYFNGSELTNIDAMLAYDCYLLGETFQNVNGVKKEDYHVVINYIDANTNTLIESVEE